jgi:hypothetical protein
LGRIGRGLDPRKRRPRYFALPLAKAEQALAIAREKATLDLQNLQQAVHQFPPQRVVEDVIKRGLLTPGEVRKVTVPFADIVEFTAIPRALSSPKPMYTGGSCRT